MTMNYPKPIMKLSELRKMGFDEAWLLYIYNKRSDLKIAWKGGNGKGNSPIMYDTEGLERFRRASCTGN